MAETWTRSTQQAIRLLSADLAEDPQGNLGMEIFDMAPLGQLNVAVKNYCRSTTKTMFKP
jgi:hypothetical protein